MEAVGLATDVFDNTIRLFKFITALVDMPKECEKYRLQLIIEYNRVLAWGKAAGLVDVPEDGNLASTLGTNPTELISIVARIQWLLAEFRDINSRYGNELNKPDNGNYGNSEKQTIVTDTEVLRQISNLAVSYEAKTKERRRKRGLKYIRALVDKATHNTKEIITHPSRVRWVMVDHETFEALLQDLHVLTERLHELMRNYQQSKIDDITAKTYREMIITRNGVQDLHDMFDAVAGLVATSSTTNKGKTTYSNGRELQDLVRLKKISRTSEMILSQLAGAKDTARLDLKNIISHLDITVQRYTPDLWNERFYLNEEDDDYDLEPLCRRPRGVLTTPEGDFPVWIEYKALGRFAPGSVKDQEAALRTVALAEMLHIPKPASLHVPQCVGYFDDREIGKSERYGWIFKMSEGSNYQTQVHSLYEILGDQSLKPTLSQRLAMAYKLCSTVLNLHAANWLHKGIFSDNVVFHLAVESPFYDPTAPCLSGFEFSRPEGTETTSRETDLAWDLYRWPGIQRQPPMERNSRKTYDLYSLGLVLLEIAHWEPLWKILGLSATVLASSINNGGGGGHVERRAGGGVLSRVSTMISRMSLEGSSDDEGFDTGSPSKTSSDEDQKTKETFSRRTTATITSTATAGRTKPASRGRRRKPAIVPYVLLSDSKQVRSWLLGIQPTNPNTTQAPFEKQGRLNPVQELRNIMGDRYCEVVKRCLWAHGEKGFGVYDEEEYDHDHDHERDHDDHHPHIAAGTETEMGIDMSANRNDRNDRLVEEGIKLQDAFTRFVVEELESIVV